MSGYMNEVAPGSRPFYEMENERLRNQLATVTEQRDAIQRRAEAAESDMAALTKQRDRAWAALLEAERIIGPVTAEQWRERHRELLDEARENGDG